jgi:hypothetical protein
MKTYYIVQELGSEYNDEIYVLSDKGSPHQVCKTREEAQELADKLNTIKLSEENIRQYGYGVDEVINDIESFVLVFNEIFNAKLTIEQLEDDYEFGLPKITLDQYYQIKPYLKINFYEVVECQGE